MTDMKIQPSSLYTKQLFHAVGIKIVQQLSTAGVEKLMDFIPIWGVIVLHKRGFFLSKYGPRSQKPFAGSPWYTAITRFLAWYH